MASRCLRAAMALRAQAGASDLTSKAFERAGNAFEALVRNGDPEAADRGFRQHHRRRRLSSRRLLGRRLFALQRGGGRSQCLTPGETAVIRLILRDLDQLAQLRSRAGWTTRLMVMSGSPQRYGAKNLTSTRCCRPSSTRRSAARWRILRLRARDRRSPHRSSSARACSPQRVNLADNAENVPLWWITNLCRHLIDDLWQHSLHQNLPTEPPAGTEEKYPDLRRLFICRSMREKLRGGAMAIAARGGPRSTDVTDDLVVALPTSAGKTRVAEIAALMTLSSARRVLIVTPLRALSAQTERSFQKDLRAARVQRVVPIRRQWAFGWRRRRACARARSSSRHRRSSTSRCEAIRALIDDVGLIVLDEGHMIGPSEREIRYETLVQRLFGAARREPNAGSSASPPSCRAAMSWMI